jgi:hypothetical protein
MAFGFEVWVFMWVLFSDFMALTDYNVNPEVKGMHLLEIQINGKIEKGDSLERRFYPFF